MHKWDAYRSHWFGMRAAVALVALVATLLPGQLALAAQDATLTLQMQYESGGAATPIGGVDATAYRVATLDDAINTYELREPYASLGVDFNQGMDAAEMRSVATQAAALAAAAGERGFEAASGSDGVASFGTLPYGVYLVVQTGARGTAEKYESFEPFMVSVPQVGEDEITFDVVCLPKTSLSPVVPPTPPSRSPQTSDLFDARLWASCAAVGGTLVAVGLLGRRRNKGQDDADRDGEGA